MPLHLYTVPQVCCNSFLPPAACLSMRSSRVTLSGKLSWSLHSSPSRPPSRCPEARLGHLLWDPLILSTYVYPWNLIHLITIRLSTFLPHYTWWGPWDRDWSLSFVQNQYPAWWYPRAQKQWYWWICPLPHMVSWPWSLPLAWPTSLCLSFSLSNCSASPDVKTSVRRTQERRNGRIPHRQRR